MSWARARLGELREAFDESNLPFAVDLIEWASSSEAFRRVIAERAQPFRAATALAGQ